MPSDGRPFGEAIHATAVAIVGEGLVIVGASGSGKSTLALALIAASTRQQPIRLIGDDRVLIHRGAAGRCVVCGHPRIQGFIERRGLGILASPFLPTARVRGVVALGYKPARPAQLQNFPCLAIVIEDRERVAENVLQWWRDASTTPVRKRTPAA